MKKINSLIDLAQKSDPVYINDVRQAFEELDTALSYCVKAHLKLMDGVNHRCFCFYIPRQLDRDGVRQLASDYLKAEIYNILSSLGGRELNLYIDKADSLISELIEELIHDFGIDKTRKERTGYGRCINVIDRMLDAICSDECQFALTVDDLSQIPQVEDYQEPVEVVGEVFTRPVHELKNRRILGMDIGGTDIKLTLVGDGRIQCMKEFDWFPAQFEESRQLVEPIVLLTRLMSLCQALSLTEKKIPDSIQKQMARAMEQDAEEWEMQDACNAAEDYVSADDKLFDGIGLCFPDVVVNDKVVGGEVYKTRGIRNNSRIDYEMDFKKLTHLNDELELFCKHSGAVSFTNDGPMAAFTAALELAASGDEESVKEGFFAHTLGTELGTGWVREDGSIPDIPLEVYNCIVDLGSHPEREFDSDDLRSVRNFNTDISGTLQKFASQSGVFRLAMKYFPRERRELFIELIEKGYVYTQVDPEGVRFLVPTENPDMRKPFLEHMMDLLEREDDQVNKRIWFEIGASLGVALVETERLLRPRSNKRILFGRLVKKKACFIAMEEGARSVVPNITFEVADSSLAHTPLMKQLEDDEHFTVAQFAQAVGAVYFAVDGIIRKSAGTI